VSVDAAGSSDDGQLLPPRVASALAAAGIPPAKLGAARRARLSEPERELYCPQRLTAASFSACDYQGLLPRQDAEQALRALSA
jgi:hypothetical protein